MGRQESASKSIPGKTAENARKIFFSKISVFFAREFLPKKKVGSVQPYTRLESLLNFGSNGVQS